MVRFLIAAALGCLYVAGSIWLVRGAGQAYRDDLRRQKFAATKSDKPLVWPGEERERTPTVLPAPLATTPHRETQTPKPDVLTADARHEKPALATPSPPLPVNEVGKEKPATVPPGTRVLEPKADKMAATVNPFANSPFWNQEPFTRRRNVGQLTPDDELQLGADLHNLIVQLNPVLDEGSYLRRIEEVAKPLREHLRRKNVNYTFTILDSNVVNAFSHPGGYVYVSRGLFDLIGEDEDSALQFAIGHEIAHVDLQHALRCLQDKGVMNLDMGTVQKLYLLIIPLGYLIDEKANVDQELEADAWISNRMQRLSHTRREVLSFLQKFEGYAKKNNFENGRAKPQLGNDSSPPENHYRSQTAAWKRLKELKALMEKTSGSPKGT
jgi:hypothetical protein